MLNDLILLLVISALVACTGFVALYATNSRWRTTAVGQTMMLLAVCLIVVCFSGLVFSLVGPTAPIFPWLRLLIYIGLNVAMWRQLHLLIRIQRATNITRTDNEDQDKTPVA